jgi:hypothetical protein
VRAQSNQVIGRRDQEPLIGQLAIYIDEKRVLVARSPPGGNRVLSRGYGGGFAQFHSSAPFISHNKPDKRLRKKERRLLRCADFPLSLSTCAIGAGHELLRQGGWGSLHDRQANRRIDEFPLSADGISDRLLISEKLYGRACEVETLLSASIASSKVTFGSRNQKIIRIAAAA